jgi:hypothetical protein
MKSKPQWASLIVPSRSGEPTWSSITASPDRPPWANKVAWERADILKPKTYNSILQNATAVVHSMGILLEADYKGVLSGRESPLSGLQRAFAPSKSESQNPLERHSNQDLKPQEKNGQITYELMNRDSAITLAKETSRSNIPAFVYISAAGGAPVLPARYIQTKREAESIITREFPNMRSVFFRPGILYDSSRIITIPFAVATTLGSVFNGVTGGVLGDFLGVAGVKPSKADLVADAVVEALADKDVKGPVETEEMEKLAHKAWRRSML